MTAGWGWVESASRLLGRDEREAVLGDLIEAGESVRSALCGVLGLVLRREAELWRSWRPLACSVGLAMPASLFLMGFSLSVSGAFGRLLAEPLSASFLWISFSRLSLLICWGWVAGFAASTISRRTLWASVLACCAPCLFCLSKWPGDKIAGVQLLLFLAPAAWGARSGWRRRRIRFEWAALLTVSVTLSSLTWGNGAWVYGFGLLWPGWYLTVTGWRERKPA